MKRDRPVLVTGANGFVGSHLVDHLLERGDRVRALVRPGGDHRWLDPAAERVFGDVTRTLGLPHALAGVRAVYHVAGVVATFRPQTYRDVNACGVSSLLGACAKAAPDLERFVLVSSLAAAGPSRGRAVRETDRPRPVSHYGASKLEGERIARDAAVDFPVTVVRPPIVYGPRDTDMLTFFTMVAGGLAPAFRRDKTYSIIHVHDLARGIRIAGTRPIAAGRTYHLADSRAWSMRHLLGLIADAVGAKPRAVPVPEPLLSVLAGPLDVVGRDLGLGLRPLGDKVREMRPDAWVADTSRASTDLGFETEIPLAEGIRATAEFYRSEGWLPRL